MKFRDIPQYSRARYQIDMPWDNMEAWFDGRDMDNQIDLEPDFQRAHVWTPEQQSAFVEFSLRGGQSGKQIYFNSVGWNRQAMTPIVVVDGKQRLTAAREFMADRIPAFGHTISEYEDRFPLWECAFRFNINDLETRAEVIQWYLDLNFRGTPHTDEELQRVTALLALAQEE